MGKLYCHSSSVGVGGDTLLQPPTPTKDPQAVSWAKVRGLEDQQVRRLTKIQQRGVLWKHPEGNSAPAATRSIVFRLSHDGEVEADGNCLFNASVKAMRCNLDARELRRRTVKRFLEDLASLTVVEREAVDSEIKHMYSPDLESGWGVHDIQELKLLARKVDRDSLDSAIAELVGLGIPRELAAESIYKERCIAVDNGSSWAKYMATSGSKDDEYHIIAMQYSEWGLLSLDENRDGHAAAFGDDLAILSLATEFKREVFVVQAHGLDAMVEEENCVFFLPHRPRGPICEPPIFLFMKGTGWCGAGADHYEPLIAHPSSTFSEEKVALVL